MEIPNSIVVAGITIQTALIGGIFGMLRYQIGSNKLDLEKKIGSVKIDLEKKIDGADEDTEKCERILHKRIDKIETGLNTKMSVSACNRTQERIAVELEHNKDLVVAHSAQNSKEHGALIATLRIVEKKQDTTNATMGEMAICLALLSKKKSCEEQEK